MIRSLPLVVPADEPRHATQQRLVDAGFWTSCINCDHRVESLAPAVPSLTCGLFRATPPPAVLVVGCVRWEATIPF